MKIIELRKISYKQAKKEIREYFEKHDGEALDAGNVQEDLRIDIADVLPILDELEFEGEIEDPSSTGRIYRMEK